MVNRQTTTPNKNSLFRFVGALGSARTVPNRKIGVLSNKINDWTKAICRVCDDITARKKVFSTFPLDIGGVATTWKGLKKGQECDHRPGMAPD
jgi:hypothetical protein